MKRCLLGLALMAVLPQLLPAGEFAWLVREFSRQSGATPTYIPLFGFVRAAVAIARPAGTSQLDLAVFEHASMQPERFRSLADSTVSTNWKPMIRVLSRHGESTNIYSRPDQSHVRLLILALDGHEATFVQLRLQPERLMTFIDEHRRPNRKHLDALF